MFLSLSSLHAQHPSLKWVWWEQRQEENGKVAHSPLLFRKYVYGSSSFPAAITVRGFAFFSPINILKSESHVDLHLNIPMNILILKILSQCNEGTRGRSRQKEDVAVTRAARPAWGLPFRIQQAGEQGKTGEPALHPAPWRS